MNESTIKEIETLTRQIEKELSQSPGKINMQKVKAYQNRLIELQELKRTEPAQMQAIISDLQTKAETEARISSDRRSRAVKTAFKRIAVAALCVCFLCFSAFSITAIAVGGFSEAWEYVSGHVSELLHMLPGRYDADGITVIKGESSKRFRSLESFLQSEARSMLIPSALPDNARITKVTVIETDGEMHLYLNFNRDDLTVSVTPISTVISDPAHWQTVGGFDCYVVSYNGKYQATFYDKDLEYTVVCADFDDLIFVIENLKFHSAS
ncbi:MAG: hypothetical protein IKM00_01890 [Clostridia bacterium]|nr:hypothetical protein [Clostridia bacterium]